MSPIATLQLVAERLGLDPAWCCTAEGRLRPELLVVAGLASLALWTTLGWALLHAMAWLTR
jgi:hypothetical protein